MAKISDMAREGVNNQRIRDAFKATGASKKALAKVLKIHPSGVTRMLADDRDVTATEDRLIWEFFLGFSYIPPQNGHDGKKELTGLPYTSGQVAHGEVVKEGTPMSNTELLEYMKILVEDNKSLRDRVKELEGGPAPTGKGKSPRRP